MRKILKVILITMLLMHVIYLTSEATEEVNKLRLKVLESDEDYKVYILLPKKYIMYAAKKDGLDIQYDKANTLIENHIPSIQVNINNIEKDTYIDNNIEYIQILLENLGGEEYYFEIIKEYTDMDMLYRIKSANRDNIIYIDNFQLRDNICEMEYNYSENIIESQEKNVVKIRFNLEWWQIVIIILLLVFIVYLYNRRNK